MKFSAVASLFFASFVAAQSVDLSQFPQCSLACFAQGAAAAGCALNDLVCQCTTGRDAITKAVTPCVLQNCNAADQAKVTSVAITACQAVVSGGTASGSSSASGSGSAATSRASSSSPAVSTGGAVANQAAMIGAGAGVVAALLL